MTPSSRTVPRLPLCSLLPLLIVAIMSIVLSGCENGDVTASGSADTTITTETSVSETVNTSSATTSSATISSSSGESSTSGSAGVSTSSEELLSNGHIRACGIIKQVWTEGSAHKLTIDYVDFLTGDEADAAAVAAGEIAVGEHVENDYYVRNSSTKLRTFTVADSAVITTDERGLPSGQIVTHTWSEFADYWRLGGEEAWLSQGLWWIERDGYTVVRIDQQFVP